MFIDNINSLFFKESVDSLISRQDNYNRKSLNYNLIHFFITQFKENK